MLLNDVILEALLSQVDEPSQFAVPGLGIFISPFGEKLAEFIVSLGCIMNTSEKCVSTYIYVYFPDYCN